MLNRKQINGKELLFAAYSNRWNDRDDEIITRKSHQKNDDFITEFPQLAPDLLWFHDEKQKFDAVALWWGFDGNYPVVIFELSENDSKKIDELETEHGELIFSHGFFVKARYDKYITDHYTFEISLLPKKHAANYFTVQERNKKEAVMPIQKLSEEKQIALLQSGVTQSVAEKFYAGLDEKAEVLDQMGVETKSTSTEVETETVVEVEMETEEVAVEPDTSDESPLLTEGIVLLTDQLTQLREEISAMKSKFAGDLEIVAKAVGDLKETEAKQKAAAMSPSSLSVAISNLQKMQGGSILGGSVVGNEDAVVRKNSKLAKAKPAEAQEPKAPLSGLWERT